MFITKKQKKKKSSSCTKVSVSILLSIWRQHSWLVRWCVYCLLLTWIALLSVSFIIIVIAILDLIGVKVYYFTTIFPIKLICFLNYHDHSKEMVIELWLLLLKEQKIVMIGSLWMNLLLICILCMSSTLTRTETSLISINFSSIRSDKAVSWKWFDFLSIWYSIFDILAVDVLVFDVLISIFWYSMFGIRCFGF